MCLLDLAPEAPWKCPDDCPAFEARLYDAGFVTGSLAPRPTPPEPETIPGPEAAALLDEAEDIINAVGPAIVSEVQARRDRAAGVSRRKWWRFGR